LSLSGAHPNNNFKIDDIEEYEFVQKQRAFLYDPLHIKNSNQFKSFSSLVGFGSMPKQIGGDGYKLQKTFDRNTVIQSLLQDTKQPGVIVENVSKLEQTPAMQQVLLSLNINFDDE